jgi:dsDNA-binding SOS-regulon protein
VRAGPSVIRASSRSTYILKLEGPLDTAAKVQEAANLEVLPAITPGTGELGDASFVTMDTTARDAIAVWLSKQRTNFVPTFVRISKSGKDLSEHSMYPTLGVDTTLPQYRADSLDAKFVPTQNQYPVWYFFYGSLAIADILSLHLALSEKPIFIPAIVTGGVIKKWKGKYNALLDSDGAENACVDGWAYLVETEEHEEALRLYETENYEIVRCAISMEGRSDAVKGLTFKFVGPSEHLT